MNISKPMAGLTAVLCSLGLMTAGAMSAMADDATTLASSGLPDHIVNGDFEYPAGLRNANWTLINPETGMKYDFGKVGYWGQWEPIADFDADLFGWKSTQTATADHFGGSRGAGAVEIQTWGNNIAQIVESQQNTAIYQDVAVIPGAVYTLSLKHAPMVVPEDNWHTDTMQVLIGPPGHEEPVEMTRTKSNGYGDKVGVTSTTISTTGNSGGMDFDTYEGVWVCPEDVTVARFTFRSLTSHDPTTGNQVDDISFQVSWPLTYDLQGGTGIIPNKED